MTVPLLISGRPLAVVNEDGTPIAGGAGGSGPPAYADAAVPGAPLAPLVAFLDGSGVVHVVTDTDPLPVVGGTGGGGGGLTDTQLRATPVPVSGTFWQATQPVSGPLTDAQLRAADVPVALNAASLAALETIQVGSLPAVALDVATLAALETIQIGSMPAVALDSATLAALEAITVQNGAGAAAVNIQDGGNSITVDGTFWQATQPVSGPLTDAQLRATPVPVSGTVATGGLTDTQLRASAVPVSLASVPSHAVTDGGGSLTVDGSVGLDAASLAALETTELGATTIAALSAGGVAALYRGRSATFRIPGLAGTTGQNLLAIFNTHATKTVIVHKVLIDVYQTVIKAVTVPPPIIRLHRITAAATGGAALSKVAEDSSLTTDAAVTLLQGASADGAGVALVSTPAAGSLITQEFAARMITAAGYEMHDRVEFMGAENETVTLRQNQGVLLRLDYTAATQNPITDMWIAAIRWEEYT